MNNNNFQANAVGANGPKVCYARARFLVTDISFISFTVLTGESNNAGTEINGRGKGAFDRYGLDFRYTSRYLPGLMVQGEWWQGHDGANQTTVGTPAQGACAERGPVRRKRSPWCSTADMVCPRKVFYFRWTSPEL